jgi:hypothetical protein
VQFAGEKEALESVPYEQQVETEGESSDGFVSEVVQGCVA